MPHRCHFNADTKESLSRLQLTLGHPQVDCNHAQVDCPQPTTSLLVLDPVIFFFHNRCRQECDSQVGLRCDTEVVLARRSGDDLVVGELGRSICS
eukprot:2125796-Rhodomonas_salina.2